MQSEQAEELKTYQRAADDFAASPGRSESITTMMRLACEGVCLAVRQRARNWLFVQVGVRVTDA